MAIPREKLEKAVYPQAWQHHKRMGMTSVCPVCGEDALIRLGFYIEKLDEFVDCGEACEFCGYRKDG